MLNRSNTFLITTDFITYFNHHFEPFYRFYSEFMARLFLATLLPPFLVTYILQIFIKKAPLNNNFTKKIKKESHYTPLPFSAGVYI